MHPEWRIEEWSVAGMNDFVDAHGGPLAPVYAELGSSLERDTFFRFFVLWALGGVFIDRRVELNRSLDGLDSSARFFACVDRRLDPEQARREMLPDPLRLGPYLLGSAPRHPILAELLDRWRALTVAPRPEALLLEVSAARLLTTTVHRWREPVPDADVHLLFPDPMAPATCDCPRSAEFPSCQAGRFGVYVHTVPAEVRTPLVSALCVTHNSLDLLTRAVRGFAAQTYPARELLIVYESDHDEAIARVKELQVEHVRFIRVPIDPKRSLGELRNISIAEARGEFVTQWDDDDVYHPARIEVQVATALARGDAGNVLSQRVLFDQTTRRAWLSNVWPFEGSILVRREVVQDLAYRPRAWGEETDMVFALLDARLISLLCRPELYVYVFHGSNTFDRAHFEAIFARGSPLNVRQTAECARIVDGAVAGQSSGTLLEGFAPSTV